MKKLSNTETDLKKKRCLLKNASNFLTMGIFNFLVRKIGKYSFFHMKQCTLNYFLTKARFWKNQVFILLGPKDSTRKTYFGHYDFDVKNFMRCIILVIALKSVAVHNYAY